jgi:hypothetical protein
MIWEYSHENMVVMKMFQNVFEVVSICFVDSFVTITVMNNPCIITRIDVVVVGKTNAGKNKY